MNLWPIFLTGLTGGLTCLAVQGGLLTTAITKAVTVQAVQDQPPSELERENQQKQAQTGIQIAKNPWPVVYFLTAKLTAYTLLGALLGALGSVLTISPAIQAGMLVLAGLFMLATALNMLNVHPIFRYVVLQPPKALTRLVRNQAKSQEAFAPVMLGLMTVFIPCSTTLAMESLAISSANPLYGAAILGVFVLGTSPTFLVLGFLATQLRGTLQKAFAFAAALLVLGIGLFAIDSGLVLLDAPFAPRYIIADLLPSRTPATEAVILDGVQELTINAFNGGYAPRVLVARSGVPTRLKLETNQTFDCSRTFMIPSRGVLEHLPETGVVEVDLGVLEPGEIQFTCGMGMYTGKIVVIQ